MWRQRFVLAGVLLLVGGAILSLDVRDGWYLVAIGSALVTNATIKLRGLRNTPRIEFQIDRLAIWGILIGSPRVALYSDIRLVEWRIVRRIGVARISIGNLPAFVVVSSWLRFTEDFHAFIQELKARLPTGRVVEWRTLHATTAYFSMFVATVLVAVHVFVVLRTPPIGIYNVIAHGAFVPVLVARGEWFRLVTSAALHASWRVISHHLVCNSPSHTMA